ncbi:MAG: hypothetical protein ABQ298_03685 [Puniceicoccaceae bacterium]
MSDTYPIIRELRKMDEELQKHLETRYAALVMRAAATSLERYEHLRHSVRDVRETLRDGSDPIDVKIAVAKLGGLNV